MFVTRTVGAGLSGSVPLATGACIHEFFPLAQVCTVGKTSVPSVVGAVKVTPKLPFVLSGSEPPVKLTTEPLTDDVHPFGATPATLVTLAGTRIATDVVGDVPQPWPMTNDTVATDPGFTWLGDGFTWARPEEAEATTRPTAAALTPTTRRRRDGPRVSMTGRPSMERNRSIDPKETFWRIADRAVSPRRQATRTGLRGVAESVRQRSTRCQTEGVKDRVFDELVRRHEAALTTFARSITRDRWTADDAVQDTLVRAWKYIDTFDRRGSFEGWLLRICRNVVIDAANAAARRPESVEPTDLDRLTPPVEEDASHDLIELLHQLSVDHREVLVLVGVLGLSYDEAADALDLPVGTVRSRLARARSAFSELLAGSTGETAARGAA